MLNLYNSTSKSTTPSSGGSVVINTATIDFGTSPVYSKQFSVIDPSATTSSKIIVVEASTDDETEMDILITSAVCLTNGTITIYAHGHPGPITNQRKIHYILG